MQGIRLPRKPRNAHENVSESGSILVHLNEFPMKSIVKYPPVTGLLDRAFPYLI